jgi:hypothetical protein
MKYAATGSATSSAREIGTNELATLVRDAPTIAPVLLATRTADSHVDRPRRWVARLIRTAGPRASRALVPKSGALVDGYLAGGHHPHTCSRSIRPQEWAVVRKAVVWRLGIGVVAAVVVAGYAIYTDVTWNVPLILVLFMVAFLPAAKEIGRGKALQAGARLRKRRDDAKQRDT